MKINSLGIFLTRKCNFRCIYCCTDIGEDPTDKMTFNEIKGALLQAKASGIKCITVPGEGEPFLDENLFPLIDLVSMLGLKMKVYTNGTLIDKKKADYLFKKRVAIVYKLHSLDKSVYDLLIGISDTAGWKDYHDPAGKKNKPFKIPQGLKYLLEAGYAEESSTLFSESLLQIQSVITKKNIKCMPHVASFCKSLGLDFMVETLIMKNMAKENAGDLEITDDEEMKVYSDLGRILGWKFMLQQKKRCCYETNPFLDISGNIRHCFSLPADVGNIRDEPLRELHQKELSVRNEKGMISKAFSFKHKGFRYCASRKVIN